MLQVRPYTLKQANKLVGAWHRHHKPEVGHRWSIGVLADGEHAGAVIVGRPKARLTDQYFIAEATRLVTNGTTNACSKLYAAAARAAEAMGFDEIQTFILKSESGVSLIAAGWTGEVDEEGNPKYSEGGKWDRPCRKRRRNEKSEEPKRRFYKKLRNAASSTETGTKEAG